jgi:hypothetical protein
MSKTTKQKAATARRVTPTEQSRIDARNALNRGVRREREIQRLTKQLDRLFIHSETLLVDFARRIVQAERTAIQDAKERKAANG